MQGGGDSEANGNKGSEIRIQELAFKQRKPLDSVKGKDRDIYIFVSQAHEAPF